MRSLVAPLACFSSSGSSSSSCGSDLEDEEFHHHHHHQDSWSVADSMALYRVQGWGHPYFSITSKGELAVRPEGRESSPGIPLRAVIERVVESSHGNLSPPLIIRFPQIARSRLLGLQSAFDRAILQHGYKQRFQGVFPVKCNPDRLLVEELVASGKQVGFGLEAGSKPELLLAMSCLCSDKASPNALLVCNGYKDEEYIQLALVARSMGLDCILVVEQAHEIDLILKVSHRMGISPAIGLRCKLSTKNGGHWADTCGENGKFGVTCSEIVDIVRRLKLSGMLGCLQLLHFHVGSQIPCLQVVRESVSEAAHIFCELLLMGAEEMRVLDIGGGLGVDYDGSSSPTSDLSVGYSVQEYALEVVSSVAAVCGLKGVTRAPVICCESGRGLVSHQSVLVFDVSSVSKPAPKLVKEEILGVCRELEYFMPGAAQLSGAIENESLGLAVEYARKLRNEAAMLFKAGVLGLEVRGGVERLQELVLEMAAAGGAAVGRAATYHMNLSMFKAIPDTWAIGQLFPIVPLQRLDEQPRVRAILSDLTCDSDGRISSFVCGGEAEADDKSSPTLPVHEPEEGKGPYYLGLFLAGAYQEALSSMHNLFGAIHVVHCVEDGDGSFRITEEMPGHSISAVLKCAHYHPGNMFDTLRRRVVSSLAQERFASESQARAALQLLARSFSSYTYLLNPSATTTSSTTTSYD